MQVVPQRLELPRHRVRSPPLVRVGLLELLDRSRELDALEELDLVVLDRHLPLSLRLLVLLEDALQLLELALLLEAQLLRQALALEQALDVPHLVLCGDFLAAPAALPAAAASAPAPAPAPAATTAATTAAAACRCSHGDRPLRSRSLLSPLRPRPRDALAEYELRV